MEVEGSDAAAALASPGPGPLPATAHGTQALIAGAGSEYVRRLLCVSEPGEAIESVQRRGALRDPASEPLVGLLDHMGQSRAEVRTRVERPSVEGTAGATRRLSDTHRRSGVPRDDDLRA